MAFSEEDLRSIPAFYTFIEKTILCGDDLDIPSGSFIQMIRGRCIEAIKYDRFESMFSFDQFLAMLAHACACPISSLLPPGEVSFPAENYLRDQLRVSSLKLVDAKHVRRVTLARVSFVFSFLTGLCLFVLFYYGDLE